MAFNAKWNRVNRAKIEEMKTSIAQKTMTKVLLALKYHSLTMKGVNMINGKQNAKLLVKAVDALRYFAISQRVTKKFIDFKQGRSKQAFLKAWISRYQLRIKQKEAL